jgi:hypothetical protein
MPFVCHKLWIGAGLLAAISGGCWCSAQQQPAGQLVREVSYNELHDHERHGYWRYWVEKRTEQCTRLEQQIETSEGTLARLMLADGRPLNEHTRHEEQARLDKLMNSPREQASQRQAFAEDEKRIATVLTLMPDAFLYEYAGDENGRHRLRYRPNPSYVPKSMEARVVHAMSGEMWVDARLKRLVRMDGRLEDNVDFGFGMLGRLNKGGWFGLQRTQVSATEWKTERLEVHVTGRAVIKTISRETSEVRGGFATVPAGMNLAQGVRMLQQSDARNIIATAGARAAPVALAKSR